VLYRLLADLVLVLHLGFILFVALGGILVRWRRPAAFVHLPCAAYGAAIELWGWTCPLTPLENRLRGLGGEPGYTGGFIEHYLVPLVYPDPLTHGMQLLLGLLVVVANAGIYLWALRRRAPPASDRGAR
jgi:uncharacterized protein DUF2784